MVVQVGESRLVPAFLRPGDREIVGPLLMRQTWRESCWRRSGTGTRDRGSDSHYGWYIERGQARVVATLGWRWHVCNHRPNRTEPKDVAGPKSPRTVDSAHLPGGTMGAGVGNAKTTEENRRESSSNPLDQGVQCRRMSGWLLGHKEIWDTSDPSPHRFVWNSGSEAY